MTGGKLYGYDSTGNVIEHEAEIVREIFAMVGEGGFLPHDRRHAQPARRALGGRCLPRATRRPRSEWITHEDESRRIVSYTRLFGRLVRPGGA